MQRFVTILAGLATLLAVLGSIVLALVVLSRTNHPNNWSFAEVIGYPGALIGAGLAVALIAVLLARMRDPDGR